jgi:hypothetical protein
MPWPGRAASSSVPDAALHLVSFAALLSRRSHSSRLPRRFTSCRRSATWSLTGGTSGRASFVGRSLLRRDSGPASATAACASHGTRPLQEHLPASGDAPPRPLRSKRMVRLFRSSARPDLQRAPRHQRRGGGDLRRGTTCRSGRLYRLRVPEPPRRKRKSEASLGWRSSTSPSRLLPRRRPLGHARSASGSRILFHRCERVIRLTPAGESCPPVLAPTEQDSPTEQSPRQSTLLPPGLPLAGANHRDTPALRRRRILTAEEIVLLDLSGAEWVVSSRL